MVRPFYTEEKESTQESHQDESPDMSPTYSQMINVVSLDDEDFEINKDLLKKDFYSKVNKEMRVWFFRKVPEDIKKTNTNQCVTSSYTIQIMGIMVAIVLTFCHCMRPPFVVRKTRSLAELLSYVF